MRIDNSYLAGLGAGEISSNTEASETAPKGESKLRASSYPLHVPSAELDQLRQLLQATPDVRPEIMARVSALMQTGYYSSPEAAQRTADSMIRAIE